MSSTTQAESPAVHSGPQYKGKLTHRSWPQLPEEIIRLIGSHYLYDLAATSYCPQTWEARKHWYSRMAYTCIRDSLDLEKCLMSVCPEWRKAIEKHPFWNQALHVIDPNDFLIYHMVIHPIPQLNASSNTIQAPIYLTPYQHLRNILKCTCVICRINYPLSNFGLANSKRAVVTTFFGPITVCKEHERNRTTYCGLCLRDSMSLIKHDATARDYELQQSLGILENEDEDTWPGVEVTCRKCRTEWLWRRASQSARDRDAVGGPTFQCRDWQTRHNIDNFVELAEGTIADVLTQARESLWLNTHTKYEDLGQHMLAAQKTQQRHDVRREEEEEDEEEDDSEEDREAMLTRGSGQVREMSLNHWARQRILDGHWLSPADIWYQNSVPGRPTVVPAVHPCPWARQPEPTDPATGEEQQHPLKSILIAEVPPSFQLCEQAYIAHIKQMREVLGPPMRNLVRKLVMECSVPTEKSFDDPAHLARKMSLDDVIKVLREEEGVWYDGIDWFEKKRNEDEETSRRKRIEEADADAALMSSTHGSSNATSPVLSTTTLQTTPSPPPLSDEGTESVKKEEETPTTERQPSVPASRPRFIPVDPVKSPPRLLSTIPYIPVTTAHLPHYSLDAVRSAWRDACAPLYHCSCSVCERAKVADMNARAAYAALNAPAPVVPSQPVQQTLRTTLYPSPIVLSTQTVDASEIELKEVNEIDPDGDGEEEVDYDASDLDYDEDDEDDEDPAYDNASSFRYSVSPDPEAEPERRRKRSSDELEEE
ncbi:hypothetical protein BDZ97DRAFT_1598706, partial [Flammula alnicola]